MRLAGGIPGQSVVSSIGQERAAAKAAAFDYFDTSWPKYLSAIAW